MIVKFPDITPISHNLKPTYKNDDTDHGYSEMFQ